jgi:hypothetical protein
VVKNRLVTDHSDSAVPTTSNILPYHRIPAAIDSDAGLRLAEPD